MKRLVFLVIIIFLMVSCQYSPYTDLYTIEQPEEEDVIGIYEFEKQTVNYSLDQERIEDSRPIIIVKADKNYEVKEIPYFSKSGTKKYNYKNGISKTGVWSLVRVGSVDFGSSGIKEHWGINLTTAPEEIEYAGLLGSKKVNGIIFKYGDPDNGSVMIFKKVANLEALPPTQTKAH